MIECPRFVNEREGLLNAALRDHPGMNEFIRMFQSENEDQMRNLGLLCLRIMIEYNKHVFVEDWNDLSMIYNLYVNPVNVMFSVK